MWKRVLSHPWLFACTFGSIIVGFLLVMFGIVGFINIGTTTNPFMDGVIFTILLICGVGLILGIMWLRDVSEGFDRWDTLPGNQKGKGILLLIPGFFIGIFIFIAFLALGA